MGALTKDRNTERKDGILVPYPVAAGVKIYAGGMVCLNAAKYAVPGADVAGLVLLGKSEEYVDNSTGANGDLTVLVYRKKSFEFACAGMTQADEHKPVFIADDQTVALSTTNHIPAGIILEFSSATSVWVDIEDNRIGAPDADSVAAVLADLVTDHNDLLAKLRAARLIAT